MSEAKNQESNENLNSPSPNKEVEDDDGKLKLSATDQKKREEYLKLQKSLIPSGSAIELLKEESRQKLSEKNPSEAAMHDQMNSELDKAQEKLDKKEKARKEKFAKKVVKISNEDDQLLDEQKEAAIKILKETSKYEKTIELVRDDSYNAKVFEKILAVEEKIDQLDLIFTQLLSRGKYIGREQEILPWISAVLQIIVQLFHKVNLEAYRIGVLNR